MSPLVIPVHVSARPNFRVRPRIDAAAALPSAHDRRRSGRERAPSCERVLAHPQRPAVIFRGPRLAILFFCIKSFVQRTCSR